MIGHVKEKNAISVATFKRNSKINFGVLKYKENHEICEFIEKPEYFFDGSMGIYAINKNVIDNITKNAMYGFDQLMIDGIRKGLKIKGYPHDSYWLDIGRDDDYQMANRDYIEKKERFIDF